MRFDVEGTEYDYEISGRDGQILSADTERISTVDTTDRAGTTDTAGTADTAAQQIKKKAEILKIMRKLGDQYRGSREDRIGKSSGGIGKRYSHSIRLR